MTDDTVNTTLVPLAAELIGVVRDFGPDDVAAVLARVPDGRHDALAVVLAAMVDPDKRPSQLLAWTGRGPVESSEKAAERRHARYSHPLPREHGTERGYQQHRKRDDMPACARCRKAHRVVETARKQRHRAAQKAAEMGQGKVS